MNNESCDLLREAVEEIDGGVILLGLTDQERDRISSIILSAIERATDNSEEWYEAIVEASNGKHRVFYACGRPVIGSTCDGIAKPNKVIGYVCYKHGESPPDKTAQPQRSEQQESVNPQQEWTPQFLSRLFDAECSPEEAIKRICALHESELNAESSKRDSSNKTWADTNEKLSAMLAAERQRYADLDNHCCKMRHQLIKAEHQLLSALAAIARAKPLCVMGKNQDALHILERADMNASLMEHDAEVRKPLVDAIKKALSIPTFREVVEILTDALAKVNTASICCPLCSHLTSYSAGAEVVKCGHCLRSFQLEPTKKENPDGDSNKPTKTH